LNKVLDYFTGKERKPVIIFHASEPLLAKEAVFSAIREFKHRFGFGLQTNFFLPMNFEWAKTKFAPDKWTFNFRIGFNF